MKLISYEYTNVRSEYFEKKFVSCQSLNAQKLFFSEDNEIYVRYQKLSSLKKNFKKFYAAKTKILLDYVSQYFPQN